MNKKSIWLLTLLVLFAALPCYAEPPGSMAAMAGIFLALAIGLGIVLGFLAKMVLFYARAEPIANWKIFLASTIVAILILFGLFK